MITLYSCLPVMGGVGDERGTWLGQAGATAPTGVECGHRIGVGACLGWSQAARPAADPTIIRIIAFSQSPTIDRATTRTHARTECPPRQPRTHVSAPTGRPQQALQWPALTLLFLLLLLLPPLLLMPTPAAACQQAAAPHARWRPPIGAARSRMACRVCCVVVRWCVSRPQIDTAARDGDSQHQPSPSSSKRGKLGTRPQ